MLPAAPWGNQTSPRSKLLLKYVCCVVPNMARTATYHLIPTTYTTPTTLHSLHHTPPRHHTTPLHTITPHPSTPSHYIPPRHHITPSHHIPPHHHITSHPSTPSPFRPISPSLASRPLKYIVPKATSNGCTRCSWTPTPRGRYLPLSHQSHWTPQCPNFRGSFPG